MTNDSQIPDFDFDFQTPNPSLKMEAAAIAIKGQAYMFDCIKEKIKTLETTAKDNPLGWAYKALANAAANNFVIANYVLAKFEPEKVEMFETIAICIAQNTSHLLYHLFLLMAQDKLNKVASKEIEELQKMMAKE